VEKPATEDFMSDDEPEARAFEKNIAVCTKFTLAVLPKHPALGLELKGIIKKNL
jgi:hypothetical protein